MKNVIKLMLVAGALAAFAGVSAAHESDDRRDREREGRLERREGRQEDRTERRWERREDRQEMRTRRGIRQGEITRGEAMRLRMLHRRIEMMQRRAWADGHLSLRERMAIRRAMRHQGRAVGRFNHNDRSY